MLSEQLSSYADSLEEEIVDIRRHIHKNPELGFELTETIKFVTEKLESYGYSPKPCGKAGIVALIGPETGKTFLLRADMDALPIEEETNLEFKSENGKMHACGHDTHTTMLLGAAKILKHFESELKGQVKLIFQPAEEILAGAIDCIKDGLLENPTVDAAMMMHIMPSTTIPTGTISLMVDSGIFMASADWFEIHINGIGGHGSAPETTIDPINVAFHIFSALQTLSAREVAAKESFVLTVGEMKAGLPNTSNIIPDTSYMKGTIRTLSDEVRTFVKKRMVEISEGIAKTFGATVEVLFTNGCTAVQNNGELANFLGNELKNILPEEKVIMFKDKTPSMGSEDFSEVAARVPATAILITSKGGAENIHNPRVVFDEKLLTEGIKVYAYSAIKWLEANVE